MSAPLSCDSSMHTSLSPSLSPSPPPSPLLACRSGWPNSFLRSEELARSLVALLASSPVYVYAGPAEEGGRERRKAREREGGKETGRE